MTKFGHRVEPGLRQPAAQRPRHGAASGVSSTPAFFVGDEIVCGFHTADEMGQVIDRHLAAATSW